MPFLDCSYAVVDCIKNIVALVLFNCFDDSVTWDLHTGIVNQVSE